MHGWVNYQPKVQKKKAEMALDFMFGKLTSYNHEWLERLIGCDYEIFYWMEKSLDEYEIKKDLEENPNLCGRKRKLLTKKRLLITLLYLKKKSRSPIVRFFSFFINIQENNIIFIIAHTIDGLRVILDSKIQMSSYEKRREIAKKYPRMI